MTADVMMFHDFNIPSLSSEETCPVNEQVKDAMEQDKKPQPPNQYPPNSTFQSFFSNLSNTTSTNLSGYTVCTMYVCMYKACVIDIPYTSKF